MRTLPKRALDSDYHTSSTKQRQHTAQFVPVKTKVSQVDELAELGGYRPCQTPWQIRMVLTQVADSYYHTRQNKETVADRLVGSL